jgi:hypothetical protein
MASPAQRVSTKGAKMQINTEIKVNAIIFESKTDETTFREILDRAARSSAPCSTEASYMMNNLRLYFGQTK